MDRLARGHRLAGRTIPPPERSWWLETEDNGRSGAGSHCLGFPWIGARRSGAPAHGSSSRVFDFAELRRPQLDVLGHLRPRDHVRRDVYGPQRDFGDHHGAMGAIVRLVPGTHGGCPVSCCWFCHVQDRHYPTTSPEGTGPDPSRWPVTPPVSAAEWEQRIPFQRQGFAKPLLTYRCVHRKRGSELSRSEGRL